MKKAKNLKSGDKIFYRDEFATVVNGASRVAAEIVVVHLDNGRCPRLGINAEVHVVR